MQQIHTEKEAFRYYNDFHQSDSAIVWDRTPRSTTSTTLL